MLALAARSVTVQEVTDWSKKYEHLESVTPSVTGGREYHYIHHELTRTVFAGMGLPANRERFNHEDMETLIAELDRAGLLARTRPKNFGEYEEKPFVLETFEALPCRLSQTSSMGNRSCSKTGWSHLGVATSCILSKS